MVEVWNPKTTETRGIIYLSNTFTKKRWKSLFTSMNQAFQDFVVDLGDGQVWSQSVPNRICRVAMQMCSDVDGWEFREHPGTRNIDNACTVCIHIYLHVHRIHAYVDSDDRECISRISDGAAKKTTKETSIGLSTMEKVSNFLIQLSHWWCCPWCHHRVVAVSVIFLRLVFPRFTRNLGSQKDPEIQRCKRRKKTQKDWKSYKDTLKHNHLDFVTTFLLYFSKHFLSSLTWYFEHHLLFFGWWQLKYF